MTQEQQLIKEANGVLRSFNSIVERKGANTNWEGINVKIKKVLNDQHKYMNKHNIVAMP
jgi:hypothetical protein